MLNKFLEKTSTALAGNNTAACTAAGRYTAPAADIIENDRDVRLEMDMPGVSRENLSVTVENGLLSIEGRTGAAGTENLTPLYRESRATHFARSFRLGDDINAEAVSATLKDGVLSIVLPKREEAKARVIKID